MAALALSGQPSGTDRHGPVGDWRLAGGKTPIELRGSQAGHQPRCEQATESG